MTPMFGGIAYFGDSLTDSGIIFEVSSRANELLAPFGIDIDIIPPTPPYAEAFSDGPVYADIVPDLLSIPVVQNFAVGGARALGSQFPFALGIDLPEGTPEEIIEITNFDSNLGAQVDRFVAMAAETPLPDNFAASFFIGFNDYATFTPSSEETAVQELAGFTLQIVEQTIASASEAVAAGADTVILNLLPRSDIFPLNSGDTPEEVALAEFLSTVANDALREGAAVLEAQGAAVEIVDLKAISSEINDDPSTFGFLTVDAPFLLSGGTTATPNPALAGVDLNQLGFIDFVHPTTALHGVWAAFTVRDLSTDEDVIVEGMGRDFTTTGDGDDIVFSRAGADFQFLRGGDDLGFGGLGNDFLFGQDGDDILSGGSGRDNLFGGQGRDILAGGAGNDDLFGDGGADVLIDGLGSDRAFGGAGDDIFLYTEAALFADPGGSDIFFGGAGEDTLILSLSAQTLAIEEAALAERFVAGQSYRFETFDLTVFNVETVIFSEGLGLDDVEGFTDETASLLSEADLFGFV